jgi:hypothetical protein
LKLRNGQSISTLKPKQPVEPDIPKDMTTS